MLKKNLRAGFIPRVLMKDPGTYKMLEKVYLGERENEIDQYFIESKSGQALRDRLKAVIQYGIKNIPQMQVQSEIRNFKIVNYGCGTARDTVAILKGLSQNKLVDISKFTTDCIDINSEALKKAASLIKDSELQNFNLIRNNFLRINYHNEVALGFLIGVLCGLEVENCIIILKKLRKHFIKGGLLVASNVSTTMREKDFDMAHILKYEIGWKLVYKTPLELKYIFEQAGYEWKGCFYDKPLKFHIMGIGTPK